MFSKADRNDPLSSKINAYCIFSGVTQTQWQRDFTLRGSDGPHVQAPWVFHVRLACGLQCVLCARQMVLHPAASSESTARAPGCCGNSNSYVLNVHLLFLNCSATNLARTSGPTLSQLVGQTPWGALILRSKGHKKSQ